MPFFKKLPLSLHPTVISLMRKAGWFAGRDVLASLNLPPPYSLFPWARRVLSQLGGLHVHACDSKSNAFKSDVVFDLFRTAHLESDILRYQHEIEAKLYPLGEVRQANSHLLIDEHGRTYLMNGSLVPLATTFARGLKKLLLGWRPLILPVPRSNRLSNHPETQMQAARIQYNFDPAVVDLLREAGWREGRDVLASLVLPPQYSLFAWAERVMAEFGCLHVGKCETGIDCATSDVEFNLFATSHLASNIALHQKHVGARLYPVGNVHMNHCYMLIDEYGRTYLMNDSLLPLAATFSKGLEKLLLGKTPGFDDSAHVAR